MIDMSSLAKKQDTPVPTDSNEMKPITSLTSSGRKSFADQESLLQFIDSDGFTLYTNIEYLIKYSHNIGIHFYLCEKLLTFPHYSLQFYIPQFVQILLTVETESMALEEALLKLSHENPHFALLTFWQLQALLGDLSNDPKCYGFEVARRNLNKLQNLLLDFSQEPESGTSNNGHNHLVATTDFIDIHGNQKMRENIHPSIIAASMSWASIGLPQAGGQIKPLVVSQGRREKSYVFTVAKNVMKKLNKNISAKSSKKAQKQSKNSKSSSSVEGFKTADITHNKVILSSDTTKEDLDFKKVRELSPTRQATQRQKTYDIVDKISSEFYDQTMSSSINFPKRKTQRTPLTTSKSFSAVSNSGANAKLQEDSASQSPTSSVTSLNLAAQDNAQITKDKSWLHRVHGKDSFMNSMPDLENDLSNTHLSEVRGASMEPPIISKTDFSNEETEIEQSKLGSNSTNKNLNTDVPTFDPFDHHQERRSSLKHGANLLNVEPSKLSTAKKIKLLKMNYFRCETQFVIALESISQRLSRVPKDARLTMLRAELALLNRDLPAEVDIPTLLPSNKKGKLHKLVNIVCNEAQVLNSAEKVPYLLFIEYLRDDMDFDPTTESNEDLLQERPQDGSYIFDLTNIKENGNYEALKKEQDSKQVSIPESLSSISTFTKREMDLGDLSMIKVEKETAAESYRHQLSVRLAENLAHTETTEHVVCSAGSNDLSEDTSISTKRHSSISSLDDLATQMRISAVMLAQLENNSQNNVKLRDSTEEIRQTIVKSMQQVQDKFGFKDIASTEVTAGERKLENDLLTGGLLMTKLDTSYLGEDWNTKKERIKRSSKYGHLDNWDLCSVIAKSGDDLRQEAFACQLIQAIANIWQKENLDIWVKKMKILITSPTTGLVETITNAVSIHSIKKSLTSKMVEQGQLNDAKGEIATLLDHFRYAYGDSNGYKYKRAQDNFASSLAAYSLICYLLQIKDRHNGNIMVDNEGHVVHIDFGFMFSNSPGSVGFEAAPFKLTFEYIDVLGGLEGEAYLKFCHLVKAGFKALRKNADQLVSMCRIMQKESLQPCFNAGEQTAIQFEQRFVLNLSEEECDAHVDDYLIGKSIGSMYTRLYDQFQLITQGIYS